MVELVREVFAEGFSGDGVAVRTLDFAGQWIVSGGDMAANAATENPLSLWLAPGRRLVVAERAMQAPAGEFLSDVTDGLVAIELAGARRLELLAMGCALDAAALAPGRCAQTVFAGVKVLLYARGEVLILHVERSLAVWLIGWLREAVSAFAGDIPA